jgi:hypothetical protein
LIDLQHGDSDKWASNLALTSMLVALWACTHHYKGLGGDAELYGMQALSRIHSNLRNDIFLRDVSQDTYTIFSTVYAWWIRLLGLRDAALALAVTFKVCFFLAAWAMARAFFDSRTSFLAVASLIVLTGAYGAYGVFHFAEDWLTARSLGEALVITACALHFRGFRLAGLLVASTALFVHPLMALPGLLLLLCLQAPPLVSTLVLGTGVLATLAVSLYSILSPASAHFLSIIDTEWLQVVRERSQFLFLQLWSVSDWQLNARAFLSLTLSWVALGQPRVRNLCISCMLVGAAGLMIALIGGSIGPVAILVQAQCWRWVWLGVFVSIALLLPTSLRIWEDRRCGIFCATLLCSAWIIPPAYGSWCLACSLAVWLARDRVNSPFALVLRCAGFAVAALTAGWLFQSTFATAASGESLNRLASGAVVATVLAAWSLSVRVEAQRSWTVWSVCAGVFLTIAVVALPRALHDAGMDGTAAEIDEFADWRSAIPPDSNVFVVSVKNAPTFAWFTLQRPSYLTVDQSSGVVFSRATALEVRRRSQVLLPLIDPDWTLLSNMKTKNIGSGGTSSSISRPVTRDRLYSLCGDPQLNFVVARENVGFSPDRHTSPGPWRDWNLYDCRRVRAPLTAP